VENMTLKNEILYALDQDPKIDASHIGIIVDNGIVTLTGRVHSLADSVHALKVTKKVSGVKAVAQEIQVIEDNTESDNSDETISVNITKYFERDTMVPESQIQISVHNGCVTVTGYVEWLYQKNAIEQVLRGVEGVTDYTNQVRVELPKTDDQMEAMIGSKIANVQSIDSDGLNIAVHGGEVTLGGVIENRIVHNKLIDTVSVLPGVDKVIDHMTFVEF